MERESASTYSTEMAKEIVLYLQQLDKLAGD